MNTRRFSIPLTICLIGLFFLTACAQATLEPIIIRMTATPLPAAPTSIPEPTATEAAAPTEAAIPETGSQAESTPEETAPPEEPSSVEGEEVRFNWIRPLQTLEELAPIVEEILTYDGVLAASGNENSLSITYDPAVTSVEGLMERLSQSGHNVEQAE